MLSRQLHSVVLVAYVMPGRIQPEEEVEKDAEISQCQWEGSLVDGLNSHHDAKPGKAREGRRSTAFLGCSRRKGLGQSVSHMPVEGQLADQ